MAEDMERIARGVVSQALSDAGVGIPSCKRVMVSSLDRDEARSFLLAETGSWKQARETWCSLADLDPERLRRRTAEILSGDPPPAPVPVPKPPRAPTVPIRRAKAPRPGTKLADVLYYLRRPDGVAPEELMRLFGWKRPTTLTAISDLRLYYGIVSRRYEDGRYRFVSLP
jgi:hypothetical protein